MVFSYRDIAGQGGLIWGVPRGTTIAFPITFSNLPSVVGNDMAAESSALMQVIAFNVTLSEMVVNSMRINGTQANVYCRWLAIGQ